LNKLHNGNTYRRLPPNTNLFFFFLSLSIPNPPHSFQLPEVAVTLKQSMLHSLTDFIMPPNLS
jgi:hypothetical protein